MNSVSALREKKVESGPFDCEHLPHIETRKTEDLICGAMPTHDGTSWLTMKKKKIDFSLLQYLFELLLKEQKIHPNPQKTVLNSARKDPFSCIQFMQNCIAVWNYKLDNQFSNLLLDTRDGSEFFLSDRIMGQIWKSYNPFFFFFVIFFTQSTIMQKPLLYDHAEFSSFGSRVPLFWNIVRVCYLASWVCGCCEACI